MEKLYKAVYNILSKENKEYIDTAIEVYFKDLGTFVKSLFCFTIMIHTMIALWLYSIYMILNGNFLIFLVCFMYVGYTAKRLIVFLFELYKEYKKVG